MSHNDHKPAGPDTLVELLAGAEFGNSTVNDLLKKAIQSYAAGIGNAIEANFIMDTSVGEFKAHFHLCLHPVGEQPTAADHVKH